MFCQQFFHAPPEEKIFATSHVQIVRALLGRGLLDHLEENVFFRSTLKLWFAHDVSLKTCAAWGLVRWATPGRKRRGALTAAQTCRRPVSPVIEVPSTVCR